MDKSHNHTHKPNLPNQQTAVPPIYECSLLFASISQFCLFDLLGHICEVHNACIDYGC